MEDQGNGTVETNDDLDGKSVQKKLTDIAVTALTAKSWKVGRSKPSQQSYIKILGKTIVVSV